MKPTRATRPGARGWIVELQARDDGIWGRVEWTGAGRALIEDRAYRGISPNLLVDRNGVVRAIAPRRPDEQAQPARPHPRAQLGDPHGYGEDRQGPWPGRRCDRGRHPRRDRPDERQEGRQAGGSDAVGPDRAGRNLRRRRRGPDGDPGRGQGAKANSDLAATLQAENARLTEKLQAEETARKRATSEAWIDGEIAKKRAIPATERDFYVTLHMAQPDVAERVVGTIALLGETGATTAPPPKKQLQSSDDIVGKARSIQTAEAAKGNTITWAQAVRKASEGKS